MDCHNHASCTLPTRGKEEKDNDNIVDAHYDDSYGDDVTVDWPWDCVTGEYYQYVMDVRGYDQVLAIKSAVNTANDNAKSTDNINFLSISMIGKFVALITFGLMIGGAVCFKFKQNDDTKQYEKKLNDPQSYATF